jgi:hypothetical protein
MNESLDRTMYRRILQLYPDAFIEELGDEMVDTFCDSLHATSLRGRLMLWIRELLSLPFDLLRAYSSEPGSRPGILMSMFVATLFLAVSWASSHLLTNFGLFHAASVATLALGLLLVGFTAGCAVSMRRRLFYVSLSSAALLIGIATVLAVPALDRFRLGDAGELSYAIPGVRLDHFVGESVSDMNDAVAGLEPTRSPRVRMTTYDHDGSIAITAVRSGGVDGIYALISLALLLGGTYAGSRGSTLRITAH